MVLNIKISSINIASSITDIASACCMFIKYPLKSSRKKKLFQSLATLGFCCKELSHKWSSEQNFGNVDGIYSAAWYESHLGFSKFI